MCETRQVALHAGRTANTYLRLVSALNSWLRRQRTSFMRPYPRPQHVAFSLPDAPWPALQIDAPGCEDTVFGVVAHRQGTLTS